MGDWALGGGGGATQIGLIDLANTYFTSCTTSASANTKGAWMTLIDVADNNVIGLLLCSQYADSYDFLFDVGIGAEGAEVTIINNLLVSAQIAANQLMCITYVPLSVPAGVRIAARVQCTTAAAHYASLGVMPIVGGFSSPSPFTRVTTYGANTADSGGTSIDPGGTAHTKGAWIQLTASTSFAHRGFFLAFGNQSNAARVASYWFVDIAVGAEGVEAALIPNIPLGCEGGAYVVTPKFTPFIPVDIPIGTRLSARAQCGINDATDRLFDLIIYGLS